MRKVDEISLDLSRGTLGTQAQGEKWFALIGFAPLSSVTVRGHVFPTSHIEGEAASTCHTARRPRRELPDRARGLEGFVACSHLVRWGGGGPGEPRRALLSVERCFLPSALPLIWNPWNRAKNADHARTFSTYLFIRFFPSSCRSGEASTAR